MRKLNKIKKIKSGVLLLCPVLLLVACTGRNGGNGFGSDIVLELDGPEEMCGDAYENVQEGAQGPAGEESGTKEEHGGVQGAEEIYVHICGAVVSPGVYKLEAGSRVFEGIEAAGGFREDACGDFVNQADILQDGQRLGIPTAEEVEEAKLCGVYQEFPVTEGAGAKASAAVDPEGRININTASEEELGGIAGIGAGKAAAIVQYRKENGSFSSIEDIMKVSGIKEGTFAKIKDRITVK